MDALRTGLNDWFATRNRAQPPPWFAGGHALAVDECERWAVMLCARKWLNQTFITPQEVPLKALGADGRTPLGRCLWPQVFVSTPHAPWRPLFEKRRDHLFATRLITHDRKPPEGQWPATNTTPAAWETFFATMELTIFLRLDR